MRTLDAAVRRVEIAKSLIDDVNNGLSRVAEVDPLVVREAVFHAFLAYCQALDAYIVFRTGKRVSSHQDRLRLLEELSESSLRDEFIRFLHMSYSSPSSFVGWTLRDVRRVIEHVRSFIDRIEKIVRSSSE